jgi:hypothetical protein
MSAPREGASMEKQFQTWWDKFSWTAANDLPGEGSLNRRIAEAAWNAALAAPPAGMAGLRELVAKWRKNGNATRYIKFDETVTLKASIAQMKEIHNNWNRIASKCVNDASLWPCVESIADIMFREFPARRDEQPNPAGCSMMTCADELESVLVSTAEGSPQQEPITGKQLEAVAMKYRTTVAGYEFADRFDWNAIAAELAGSSKPRDAGAQAVAQIPKAVGDKIIVEHGSARWLAQVIMSLGNVLPAAQAGGSEAYATNLYHEISGILDAEANPDSSCVEAIKQALTAYADPLVREAVLKEAEWWAYEIERAQNNVLRPYQQERIDALRQPAKEEKQP